MALATIPAKTNISNRKVNARPVKVANTILKKALMQLQYSPPSTE
jgi:hypothetical protein